MRPIVPTGHSEEDYDKPRMLTVYEAENRIVDALSKIQIMFQQLDILAEIKVYREPEDTVCYIIKYKDKMVGNAVKV